MPDNASYDPNAHRALRVVATANEHGQRWIAGISGLAALAGTTLLGVNPWLFVLGLAFAAVAAVSTGLHDWWRTDQENAQQALEQSLLTLAIQAHGILADELDPIARTIAEMPGQSPIERERTFAKVLVQAVNTIQLVNESVMGLRSVVYQIADDDSELTVAEVKSRGHRLAPNPFLRGTPRGDKAFHLIASGEAIFVDDVAAAPRDRWEGSGTGYNTFISCPITTPSNSYGMLTVDAVNTDDLTEQNLSDLRLIAGILAVAFSLRNGAA